MLPNFTELAMAVGSSLEKKSLKIVTAESCTGGWLSQVITSIPGASRWFDSGFITYSNASKTELLGVSSLTLQKYGAVSEEVASEMADGALKHSNANISLSITGIAGPDGGSEQKPVGMVCFALAMSHAKTQPDTQYFKGNRDQIRAQAVEFALKKLNLLIR